MKDLPSHVAWCADLTDAEIARMYAALSAWAFLDTSNLLEENIVFRLGRKVHGEAERRGLDRLLPWVPPGFNWPFENWDTFQALAADRAPMPDWMRKATHTRAQEVVTSRAHAGPRDQPKASRAAGDSAGEKRGPDAPVSPRARLPGPCDGLTG